MKVLAGDIGATNARLAIVDIDELQTRMVHQRSFATANYPGLGPIVRAFLAEVPHTPESACFGIACPMEDGHCTGTNLPWSIGAESLAEDIRIPMTRVINDLHAIGRGVLRLRSADSVTLQAGVDHDHGAIAVIAAGTGLGEAILTWDGSAYAVQDSEGGHGSFSPRNDLEVGLLRALARRFGHVSRERVVSGPGLVSIYEYLVEIGWGPEQPAVRMEMEAFDPAAVIGRHGVAGTDPLCAQALDMFAAAYGSQAGNLALTAMAKGGVYVAGGIAVRILRKLRDGTFMAAFRDKGRLSHILERIPVRVVVNPHVGLIGAASVALELGQLSPGIERNLQPELA